MILSLSHTHTHRLRIRQPGDGRSKEIYSTTTTRSSPFSHQLELPSNHFYSNNQLYGLVLCVCLCMPVCCLFVCIRTIYSQKFILPWQLLQKFKSIVIHSLLPLYIKSYDQCIIIYVTIYDMQYINLFSINSRQLHFIII